MVEVSTDYLVMAGMGYIFVIHTSYNDPTGVLKAVEIS